MTVKVGDKIVVACDDYSSAESAPRGSICYVVRVHHNSAVDAVVIGGDGFEWHFHRDEYTPYIEPAREPAQTKVWAMYDGQYAPHGVESGKWYPVRDCGDTFQFLPTFNEDDRQKWSKKWQRHVGPTPPDAQEAALQQLADMGQAFDADGAKPLSAFAPIGDGDVFAIYGADTPENPPYIENGTLYMVESGSLRRLGEGTEWSSVVEELTNGSESLGVAWKLAHRAGEKAALQNAAPSADGWITHDGSAKRPKGVGKRDWVRCEDMQGTIWGAPASMINWEIVTRYRVTKRAEKRRKVWVVMAGAAIAQCFLNKDDAMHWQRAWGGKLYTAKLKEVTE